MICFENPDLYNIVPFILNDLLDKYNVYDVLNLRINTQEDFIAHHKEVKRYNWKKISFNCYSPNMQFVKTIFKKRVEKGQKLVVKNRTNSLKQFLLSPVWENIQNNLYKQIITFYTKQNISK